MKNKLLKISISIICVLSILVSCSSTKTSNENTYKKIGFVDKQNNEFYYGQKREEIEKLKGKPTMAKTGTLMNVSSTNLPKDTKITMCEYEDDYYFSAGYIDDKMVYLVMFTSIDNDTYMFIDDYSILKEYIDNINDGYPHKEAYFKNIDNNKEYLNFDSSENLEDIDICVEISEVSRMYEDTNSYKITQEYMFDNSKPWYYWHDWEDEV